MNRETREKMEYQKKRKKETAITGVIFVSVAILAVIMLLSIFDVDLGVVMNDIGNYFSEKKIELVNDITGMGNGKAGDSVLGDPSTTGETKKSLDSLTDDINNEVGKWDSY